MGDGREGDVGSAAAASSGAVRVLVVDDHPAVRAAAVRGLRRQGFDAVGAASEDEAAAECRARAPRVVVADLVLADASGLDVVARLRAQCPGVHVVYMSGHPRDAVPASRLVGAHFLQKPFTVDTLARAVREALARAARGTPGG